MTQQAAPIAYISTITDVREVALRGTADLAYWRDHLRPEGLAPFDEDGRAALLVTAIESKFRGIPFREMSISVVLQNGGAFLAHAFNSSRLLAFAERAFFQTPYHLARLDMDERLPAWMAVDDGAAFSARMGNKSGPGEPADELFEGPIYLPGGRKVFHARLSGAGVRYPFAADDVLDLRPEPNTPIFARLVESGFAGQAWLLRAGAVHARSKTFAREGDTFGANRMS